MENDYKKMSVKEIIETLENTQKKLTALERMSVTFNIIPKDDNQMVLPIVDFKHSITDKIRASIGRSVTTGMPVIIIREGEYKDRQFIMSGKDIMKVIENILKEK